MVTDPIADMVTRIRNATHAEQSKVDVPASRVKAAICKVLKAEGFIRSFKVIAKEKNDVALRINLKEKAIAGIQRVSTPGLREYRGYDEFPRILSGLGISIVSTSQGVLSSHEAKRRKVGGEILCKVW